MSKFTCNKVEEIFNSYPQNIKPKMRFLRQLILETALEINIIDAIEETLKWGEPSYLTAHSPPLPLV